MKKMVFALLLVVLLLSLALPVVAMAGMGAEDPCTPGYGHGNGHCFLPEPAGLQGKIGPDIGPGKSGDNWIVP